MESGGALATPFSQRAERWRQYQVGTNRQSIGKVGCLLCAVASVVHDLTGNEKAEPGWLNAWLRENGGYYDGNLLVWRALEPLGLRIEQLVRCDDGPAPVDQLRAALSAPETAAVVKIDFLPATRAVDGHWVRALQFQENDLLVMDPWQMPGNEFVRLLGQYGRTGWNLARAICGFTVLVNAPEFRMDGGGPDGCAWFWDISRDSGEGAA